MEMHLNGRFLSPGPLVLRGEGFVNVSPLTTYGMALIFEESSGYFQLHYESLFKMGGASSRERPPEYTGSQESRPEPAWRGEVMSKKK